MVHFGPIISVSIHKNNFTMVLILLMPWISGQLEVLFYKLKDFLKNLYEFICN